MDDYTRRIIGSRWDYRERKITGRYARIVYRIVLADLPSRGVGGIEVNSEDLAAHIVEVHNAFIEGR